MAFARRLTRRVGVLSCCAIVLWLFYVSVIRSPPPAISRTTKSSSGTRGQNSLTSETRAPYVYPETHDDDYREPWEKPPLRKSHNSQTNPTSPPSKLTHPSPQDSTDGGSDSNESVESVQTPKSVGTLKAGASGGIQYYYPHARSLNQSILYENPSLHHDQSITPAPLNAPYVIFAARRHPYLRRTLESLHHAIRQRGDDTRVSSADDKVTCLFSIDAEAVTPKVRELIRSVKFCNVVELNHFIPESADLVVDRKKGKIHHKTLRFLLHWIWTMEQVFDVRAIKTDVIFLEEDVPLSPDHRDVAAYMIHARNNPHLFPTPIADMLRRVSYLGLAGWGGENMVNADPRTFVVRSARRSLPPTLGYMFNSTFWAKVSAHKDMLTDPRGKSGYDWSIGLLLMAREVADVDVAHLVPTLSRAWHIGASSSIQNHHWNTLLSSPWKTFPYPHLKCDLTVPAKQTGQWSLPSCYDNFVIKPHIRDQFGNICKPAVYREKTGVLSPVCRQAVQEEFVAQWPLDVRHVSVCRYNDNFPCPYEGSDTAKLWQDKVGFEPLYLPNDDDYESIWDARAVKRPGSHRG